MSELAQAVAEADAMEDALATPLFDGVRDGVEAVLDGELMEQELDHWRDSANEWLSTTEWLFEKYKEVEKERDEARHARGQMELRWRAAEAECAALRAKCERLIEERNEARLICARAEGQIADAMFLGNRDCI